MENESSFKDCCIRFAALTAESRQLDGDITYLQNKLKALSADGACQPRLAKKTRQQLDLLLSRSSAVWRELSEAERLLQAAAATLPQPRMSRIILYRYVEQLPWTRISEITGLEQRWLFRLHKRALGLLDTPNFPRVLGNGAVAGKLPGMRHVQ